MQAAIRPVALCPPLATPEHADKRYSRSGVARNIAGVRRQRLLHGRAKILSLSQPARAATPPRPARPPPPNPIKTLLKAERDRAQIPIAETARPRSSRRRSNFPSEYRPSA